MKHKAFRPDRVQDYFLAEWKVLLIVTVTGLVYNVGLLARPWFEGQMTGKLVDILTGSAAPREMGTLALGYALTILAVQGNRYFKRFYVRRFANNVSRRMKQVLYAKLVTRSQVSLISEGEGSIMTKAIGDVDDCVEGMRKFTTELFDTGVALLAYCGMLLRYDWRLALICMLFPPISYAAAEKLKTVVQKTGEQRKEQSAALNAATLDRARNALTYRVFGREEDRRQAYEENLAAYQMAAEVMDRVGIHEGTIFRYHQARRNTKNYQVDLETLQYDLLYGKRYSYGESGESPYLRTRMRMGIYDVTLDSIQCISEADHTYYIKGTEFTPSSEIKLNGEWYDTVYINPTTLMITGTELNDFDRLAVIQRSNSSTRKPLSKSYDRSCYALYSNNKWKLTESAGTNEN